MNTEIDKKEFQELMEEARKIFFQDLHDRILRIEGFLLSPLDQLTEEKIQKIASFFHTINGTGSTLGFEKLADIGKEWEARLRKLTRENNSFDEKLVEDIIKEIDKIKEIIYRKEEPSGASGGIPQEGDNIEGKDRILLIDDDFAILKILEDSLAREGYDVHICHDPVIAFEFIKQIKPDIILLDIMMPEIDGYKLLGRIKEGKETSDIYIIFLSAMDSLDERIKGMKLGADDYITKPFILEEVLVRIEAASRRLNKQ